MIPVSLLAGFQRRSLLQLSLEVVFLVSIVPVSFQLSLEVVILVCVVPVGLLTSSQTKSLLQLSLEVVILVCVGILLMFDDIASGSYDFAREL